MSEYGPHNAKVNRFTLKNLWQNVLRVLNLEKGIFYTIYALTLRPGKTLRCYLFEDRSKLMKPFPFLILTVTIITYLTINFVDFEGAFNTGVEVGGGAGDDDEKKKYLEIVGDLFIQSYNIIQLLSVPFLALSSYLMFRSHRYHYSEHVVMAAYLTGMLCTFFIIGFPLAYWNYMIFSLIMTLGFGVYATIAYIRVFREPYEEGIPKGIAVQVIYYISSILVMFAFMIGLAIFVIYKEKLK